RRAGLHVRLGALRRQCWARHRHAHVRGVRAAEGASGEVRLRSGPRRGICQGAAGQAVSDGVEEGSSSPLGATLSPGGVNFSVFSRHATGVQLLLFDAADDTKAARVVDLDPSTNRTYYYWHVFVPNVRPGQLYGYRVDGPLDPSSGLRFDATEVLLDPYGRGVAVPERYNRDAACWPGDNATTAMKSVVVDVSAYDWEGDAPLQRPSSQTIVYEMHVGGFTRHPSSGLPEKTRGTFAGLIEKIPYLKRLGVTAVELLPVFQFDPQDARPGLVNYWGYAPVSFFAPHQDYSSRRDALGAGDESGNAMPNPPVLWDIESDPVLAGTKLIAEAWDAAGLYQVGSFVGDSWKEWNGRFRDDVRSFLRGDDGSVDRVADRLIGSPSI